MTTTTNSVSFSGDKVKNEKHPKESLVGFAAGTAVSLSAMPVVKKISNVAVDAFTCTKEDNDAIKQMFDDVLDKSGLSKAGVKVSYIGENTEIMDIRDELSKKLMPSPQEQAKQGKNAFCSLKTGEVILPENKIAPAGFHELGHAMNKNFSKVGRVLQFCRPLAFLAGIPLLVGVFTKTKKSKDGKELSTGAKITNFIRNNAGLLTFIAVLPTVIEEAMASFKGQKLAEKVLSPELLKKVVKGNKFGLMSYVAQAVIPAVAAFAAVRVKDNMIAKKDAEKNT